MQGSRRSLPREANCVGHLDEFARRHEGVRRNAIGTPSLQNDKRSWLLQIVEEKFETLEEATRRMENVSMALVCSSVGAVFV